jgi:hypothetical protein
MSAVFTFAGVGDAAQYGLAALRDHDAIHRQRLCQSGGEERQFRRQSIRRAVRSLRSRSRRSRGSLLRGVE